MENEKTSSPRRVRDDQTQVLDDADLVEVDPRAVDALDRGWSEADEQSRTVQLPVPASAQRARRESESRDASAREPERREPGRREPERREPERREPERREPERREPERREPERREPEPERAARGNGREADAPAGSLFAEASATARAAAARAASASTREPAAASANPPPAAEPDPAPSRPRDEAVRADSTPSDAAAASTLPGSTDDERWAREAEALATAQPTRAALLLAFRARSALDGDGDATSAGEAVERAAVLAPDARFVALARRWLAEHARDHAAIAAAARAEIPLAGDALERALLHWQIAVIAQHAAGDSEQAERALREAVALDPQDLGAHLALAGLAAREARWSDAAQAWETAAARTDDLTARAALYTASASARESFLDDAAGARAALERALEADAGGAATQAALESLHLRAQAWPDYARMLVLDAERAGDLDPGLGYHERAGDVLWECLADGPAAAARYQRAAALAPGDVVPLGKLAALCEQEGRFEELVAVYEQLAARLPDPARRAGVLLRLGTLYEGRLDRPDDALRAYGQALDAMPTLAAAAQALAAHHQARGRWSELTALLLVEADRLTAPAQRAARYAAIAEQREVHLGAGDEVVALYERALALDPGQAAALDALDRIYRARERWQPLVALYEEQLAHARDPRRVRALRLTLAALYQERLDAPERAAAHLRAALSAPAPAPPPTPSDRSAAQQADDFATLAALARALAEAGQWPEHIDVLERQAALLVEEADAVATLHRIATVIETRLHDPRRALAAYQRVLERAPDHAQAAASILRLLRGQSRWDDLIAAERRLLAQAGRPEEAAATLYRIGQIAEEHLGRARDAIGAYEEALARLPGYRLARVGLERLLRAAGRFDRLAELLEQQGAPAPDGGAAPDGADAVARARILCQAATVRELHAASSGGDPAPGLAAARALHEGALALCPGFPPALWGMYRIGERSGDWAAAAGALEGLIGCASDPSVRARLLVRLARLAELRLGQVDRAAQAYDQALELQADPAAIFDRLRLALAGGGEMAGWLERAADATGDARLAAALLRLRAAAIEHGPGDARPEASGHASGADADSRGDATGDGDRGARRAAAAAAYDAALRRAGDPRALDGLTRNLAPVAGDTRLPAALAGRARLMRDAATRGLVLCAAGGLFERADAPIEAEIAYREALAAIPDFLPALAGRRRLRERDGDWAAAAALCGEMGTQARDARNKVELFEEAAALAHDRLGDLDVTVQFYRAVLAARPEHRGALDRTLAILEQTGDWGEAVAVLSDLIEAQADDGARAELLGLRARILAERLGDAHAAISDIERAARLRPDTPDLLRLLAELHESTGHWADAALAFERLAAAAPDAESAREARLAEARIWTEAVPDYPRAQRILEQVVERHPVDRLALSRLAEVALRAGDGRRAAEVYRHLAQSGSASLRAASLLALVDLQRELGDGPAAAAAVSAAFDLAGDAPDLVAELEHHHRARGDLPGFAAGAEEALVRMPLRAPGALPLRLALARVLRTELGAGERALEHLQHASRGHPKAALPRIALAQALADDEPDAAIAELRRIIEAMPTEAAAYGGLAAVCSARNWLAPATLMATAAALLGGDDVPRDLERGLAASPRPTAGSLPPEDALRFLVGASQAMPVREILEHLDPYLTAIFPDGQELVTVLEPLSDSEPAAALARHIALSLAVGSVNVYRGDAGDPLILMSEPRGLALGPEHRSGPGRAAFDSASALSRLAAGSAVGLVLEPDRVQALLRVATDPTPDPSLRELRKRLAAAMPRRARKDLERSAHDTGVIDQRRWATWEQEERRRARRAGLIFSRDLRAAAASLAPDSVSAASLEQRRAAIAASEPLLDVLRFAATDACWSLCRRIYRG
ncbi:MAG TPA: tetratricopeptide repeat protein [Kofleriaceae bacterium]|nr:tetratricopeptide repeat protein [Kofleriaceae bacterium]